MSLEELAAGPESGAYSIVDLTKFVNSAAFIIIPDGIQTSMLWTGEVNSALHAITEINPNALSIAAGLDAEHTAGTIRSSLHGVPIHIKDNVATDDLTNNTAGLYFLIDGKVPQDSAVSGTPYGRNDSSWEVKSVSDCRSSNSSYGWNAYGGQVIDAYYPDMDPSGKSSGGGVDTSIGLSFAALGAETDGTILSSSSHNDLIGIKPSV